MSRIKLRGDKLIWMFVVLLAMISIVSVFSSSTYLANKYNVSKVQIFVQQIRSVGMGLVLLVIAYFIPMKWYRALAFFAFAISIVMLLMLIIPNQFRVYYNGAFRALKIKGYTIQVFEIAKVGMILYLAKAMELWQDSINTFKDFFIKLLLPILAVSLLIMSNSFSTAILIVSISFLVMWFMGIKVKYLLLSCVGFLVLLLLMFAAYNLFFANKIVNKKASELNAVEYLFNRYGTVQSRIFNHFDNKGVATAEMEKEDKDKDFQITNAKIAISEGGLIGKGPGKSTQRFILPMAFSDFIYASIIEEYGLIMGCIIILIYLMFLFRCIRITMKCNTPFAQALVIGLSFLIVLQAFLHISVNVGIIPVTGHTLPLISHGGNAYAIFCAAFGMILSVSKQVNKQERLMREAEGQNALNAAQIVAQQPITLEEEEVTNE